MTETANIDQEWEDVCRALHQLTQEQDEQRDKLNYVRYKYKGATICYSDERAEQAKERMEREEKKLQELDYLVEDMEKRFNFLLSVKTGKCKLYESNAGN